MSQNWSLLFLHSLIFMSFLLPNTVAASAGLTTEQINSAEFVISGFRDSRQRLIRGECHITGYDKLLGSPKKVPLDCHIVFDYGQGNYRFDRVTPRDGGKNRGGRFIRTNSYTYEALGIESRGAMRRRPSAVVSTVIAPFDIRSVGLFNLVGEYWDVKYDTFLDFLQHDGELIEYAKHGDLAQLTWRITDDTGDEWTDTIWVDESRGYSCVRFEIKNENVKTSVESSWEETGGAWVPTSLRIEDEQAGLLGESEWAIEWDSVNEDIDDSYFEPASLARPNLPLSLYTEELGKIVHLETFGAVAPVMTGKTSSWRRIVLVTLNIGLIAMALIVLRARRMRSRNKDSHPSVSRPRNAY